MSLLNFWRAEFDRYKMYRNIQLKSKFPKTSLQGKPKVRNGKILLMDDDDLIREVTGLMLMRLGYHSEVSQEGSEAINIYQQAMNSEQSFSAVILDLHVKEGLNGIETIKVLKVVDPQVKAILSSGFTTDPVMTYFQEYGFQGILPKPYKMKDIEDVLCKISSGW